MAITILVIMTTANGLRCKQLYFLSHLPGLVAFNLQFNLTYNWRHCLVFLKKKSGQTYSLIQEQGHCGG